MRDLECAKLSLINECSQTHTCGKIWESATKSMGAFQEVFREDTLNGISSVATAAAAALVSRSGTEVCNSLCVQIISETNIWINNATVQLSLSHSCHCCFKCLP